MKMMILIPLALFLGLQAYVRFAPFKAADWHVDPFTAQAPQDGGALDVFASEISANDALTALNTVALATPRTTVLAGSVQEGHVSYVTRSLLWGFPDVTTISARDTETGSDIAILARLRFGKSDLGVNGKRVALWRSVSGL
jgi:uncharacterized protein (DUF1499 family)